VREGEDGDGQHREDDEVHEPVQCDEPQDVPVPQQLAAQRYVRFIRFRQVLTGRHPWRRQRYPAVAAQAAVPAEPAVLPHDHRVPGPDASGVAADQPVPTTGAAQ
jgi:hypothetical protein